MKTVILHGLGQTAKDWKEVIGHTPFTDIDCPDLFSAGNTEIIYTRLMDELERRYADSAESLCICGLSLGAVLAVDFAIRHKDKVASLVLIAPQYRVSRPLIDFQNLMFRLMPPKAFREIGLSKDDAIRLTRSMRSLDFTPRLKEIMCPVTILCGERDKVNRKASKELGALLPQAVFYLIPNAGHEMNKDAPGVVAGILQDHRSV